ncbi:GPI-anchored protein LORELEI [Ananas comosus]|uniref:GPI-anchored protein LORELEI n=1 Tax=Ananas comosus TaxID=4615 RepID=A0A199ULU5_ANACO|nr:GPI-anchored protein LORELEI [Ananas comosus]
MGIDRSVFSWMLLFVGLSGLASCSFVSDDVLKPHGSTGRSLLQAKKSCSMSFEFLNYTIITSKCKGPQYPASLCCSAFLEFACPYADYLNDATTDCASSMFSYINLNGRYPPGLFASECQGEKEGLACPPSSSPDAADAPHSAQSLIIALIASMCAILVAILF